MSYGHGASPRRSDSARSRAGRAALTFGRRAVETQAGQSVQDGVERDGALEAGQRRAEAVVDAVAERVVALQRLQVATDVEAVGIVPRRRVTVGRAEEDQQLRIDLGDVDARRCVDRAGGGAEQPVHRRVEAAGSPPSRWPPACGRRARAPSWSGCSSKPVDDVADQQRGGGAAGDEQELAEAEHLLLGEASSVALDRQQPGEQVVGTSSPARSCAARRRCGGRSRRGSRGRRRRRPAPWTPSGLGDALGHRQHPGAELALDVGDRRAEHPAHHGQRDRHARSRGQIAAGRGRRSRRCASCTSRRMSGAHRLDRRGFEDAGRSPAARPCAPAGRCTRARRRGPGRRGQPGPEPRRPRLVVAQRGPRRRPRGRRL